MSILVNRGSSSWIWVRKKTHLFYIGRHLCDHIFVVAAVVVVPHGSHGSLKWFIWRTDVQCVRSTKINVYRNQGKEKSSLLFPIMRNLKISAFDLAWQLVHFGQYLLGDIPSISRTKSCQCHSQDFNANNETRRCDLARRESQIT